MGLNGEQIFEDAASKLHSNFIEWCHTLWNRISKLFVELQKRAKRVWQQFLVNIDIPAIRNEHNDSNKFENLLLDIVRVGVWALNFYKQKNAQTTSFK
ncbi:43799_t:CDS:2 [Gigaspora margarita]|uniref:43799_t:CDS:1 n=1 Tax=Gigaspora margarita TaxID=4874 RepID=A0ABN7VZR7_GIGMA|nr:43799_t:CDS:2 [Gigaspora margarita]